MRRGPISLLLLAVAALAIAAGVTCTALVDRSVRQCKTDGDCTHFGGTLFCTDSMCTSCFTPTASNPADTDLELENLCTSYILPQNPAEPPNNYGCLAVDNCARAGICNGASEDLDGGTLNSPPTPEAGTTAPSDAGSGDAGRPSVPTCTNLAAGNPIIYLTGSSNFPPLLQDLVPYIKSQTGLVPIFRTTDSCTGAGSMTRSASGFGNGHFIRDPAANAATPVYAQLYDDNGRHDCTVGSAGAEVDIGESEIFAETCGLTNNPAQVLEVPGPILPILFVVPADSTQRAISAEVARAVLGNGGVRDDGMAIAPWHDSSLFYVRGQGTATARLIGRAIGVPIPPNRLWGVDQGQAESLATNLGLIQGAQADSAIGILGSDFYDSRRSALRALAFQARGQNCAYEPDAHSNLVSAPLDKINVRDGHYPIWGSLHFFAAKNDNGSLASTTAERFLSRFGSATQVDGDLLNAYIDASWVPECAMQVRRDQDLTTLMPYQPAFPCGCYFDARVRHGAFPGGSPCTACQSDADCHDPARPQCSYNYCEHRKGV